MANVAVIGLGRMGGSIADHLIDAGHQVAVFDISADAVALRVAKGAAAKDSAAAAARGAQFVDIIVFDDAQARYVVAGPHGVLQTLDAGSVISIHTTVTIETIRDLAELARPHGVAVLDAGISGGEDGAAAGTLVTMVGGPDDAVASARPILDCFSKEVVHAGPLGAGMALKLARNAAGYVMMAAVHEAMTLADAAGVDVDQLRHVILETKVFDQAMAPFVFGGPAPFGPDYDEVMRDHLERTLRLGNKDLDQALALATSLDAPLPVTTTSREHLHRVMRL